MQLICIFDVCLYATNGLSCVAFFICAKIPSHRCVECAMRQLLRVKNALSVPAQFKHFYWDRRNNHKNDDDDKFRLKPKTELNVLMSVCQSTIAAQFYNSFEPIFNFYFRSFLRQKSKKRWLSIRNVRGIGNSFMGCFQTFLCWLRHKLLSFRVINKKCVFNGFFSFFLKRWICFISFVIIISKKSRFKM